MPDPDGCIAERSREARSREALQYVVRMTDTATTPPVTIVSANEASWEDLQAVLGTRGYQLRCWCQRFKMRGVGRGGGSRAGTRPPAA
jgi:hypothetical protein